jgi:hypothetical protein
MRLDGNIITRSAEQGRPMNLRNLPAEPHNKSIFIYRRSQHDSGWQQTDHVSGCILQVFLFPTSILYG